MPLALGGIGDAMSKCHEMCPAPGCKKVGDFARKFCSTHWHEFKKACIANGSWSRNVEVPKPELPKWVYEGDEQALIDQLEKDEREKQGL